VIYAWADWMKLPAADKTEELDVRFRTIGDLTCTGATLSKAISIEEIIQEIIQSRNTERGGRLDDQRSETSMEDRKRTGYF